MSQSNSTEISINDLFARDPLDLTNQDLERMCEVYRKRRAQFNTTGKAPTKAAAKPKASAAAVDLASSLNLKF